jgi:hypothetical protein
VHHQQQALLKYIPRAREDNNGVGEIKQQEKNAWCHAF